MEGEGKGEARGEEGKGKEKRIGRELGNQVEKWEGGEGIKLVATLFTPAVTIQHCETIEQRFWNVLYLDLSEFSARRKYFSKNFCYNLSVGKIIAFFCQPTRTNLLLFKVLSSLFIGKKLTQMHRK